MAPNFVPIVVAPLMAFLVWRRARRQFGRQPVRPRALRIRLLIFGVLVLVLAASGLHSLTLLAGLLGGLAVGAGLGLVGLRSTRFEQGADGAGYYVPNPWIGSLLVILLIGRLAWRLLVLGSGQGMPGAQAAPAAGNSPLTLLILGLTIGYYLVYYFGVLARHRQLQGEPGL